MFCGVWFAMLALAGRQMRDPVGLDGGRARGVGAAYFLYDVAKHASTIPVRQRR